MEKITQFNPRYPKRVIPVNHRGCWSCSQLLSLSLSLALSLYEPPLRRCLLACLVSHVDSVYIYISTQKLQLKDTDCSR